MVVSSVIMATSYPLLKWLSAHQETIQEVGTCLNATALKANQTLTDKLSAECWDLLCDKCDGENLEPARQEKCEECLCEAEYDLSKMQPPLGDEVMKCCEPLKKDKGTKFLADPCEEIVTNLTKELEESTKECEKKNIINAISAQPLLLQAFVKNLPKKYLSIPKSLEVTWLLSWTSYLQGILATVLFFSIGSLLVLKRFMGNRGSGVLEEHLLPVT